MSWPAGRVPVWPVVADADYGDAAGFRQQLTDRGLVHVVGATPDRHRPPGLGSTGHPAVLR